MVVTYLGTSEVDFYDKESGNQIKGTNFWYYLDRSYSSNWQGLQVVKKFLKPNDPILPSIRSLTPGKKVSVDFMSLGKSSVITSVKEVSG